MSTFTGPYLSFVNHSCRVFNLQNKSVRDEAEFCVVVPRSKAYSEFYVEYTDLINPALPIISNPHQPPCILHENSEKILIHRDLPIL